MVNPLRNNRGLTLMEILIGSLLIGVVFIGAGSLYTSGIKQLRARQAIDVTVSPDIFIEQVARKITIALEGNIAPAGQLNVRLDQTCGGAPRNTPDTPGDDSWWHFRLTGGLLLGLCDGAGATVLTAVGNPGGTTALISNLDTGASSFTNINPSGQGTATVYSIHIVSLIPVMTVDTENAVGATAKR